MKTSFKHAKVLVDVDSVINELSVNNLTKLLKIAKESDEVLLIEKFITFADVRTNRKKAYVSSDKNKPNAFSESEIAKRANINIGFYTTAEEMIAFEKKHKTKKIFFNQTKQNSIYVPSAFYSFFSIPDATKHQTDPTFGQYLIEDYDVETYLYNESISNYFDKELTEKTYKALNRDKNAVLLSLDKGPFTKTSLHITPHGLGTTEDGQFESLRQNVFAKDKIIVLCVKVGTEKKIYISFFRNPKFFILNNLFNKDYVLARYSEEKNSKNGEEGRIGQSKWRDELAELSIGLQNSDDYYVKCPFTGTKVKYPEESAFLRASHIKAFAKCKNSDGKINIEEAYDINNGFLVIADVDALFDKYLLSVNPQTGEICKSPVLTNEVVAHLKLKNKIDDPQFKNKEKYLEIHYNEFLKRNGIQPTA